MRATGGGLQTDDTEGKQGKTRTEGRDSLCLHAQKRGFPRRATRGANNGESDLQGNATKKPKAET